MKNNLIFLVKYSKYLDYIFSQNILKKIQIKNYSIELYISISNLLCVLDFFKNHSLTKFIFIDLICYDRPFSKFRFILVYELLSYTYNLRIKLITQIKDINVGSVSIYSIFQSAGWPEREIWDLFGVLFLYNPDLRRILTDYGFYDHPLRKDFPVSGFYELRYFEEQVNFSYLPIKLVQEERIFNI